MSYLSNQFEGVTEGALKVWHKNTKKSVFFPVSDFEAAENYMKAVGPYEDVYYSLGLQPAGHTGEAKADTVIGAAGINFDADVRSTEKGVHTKTALPESWEEALAFMREELGLPALAANIHSGNGTYFQWRLKAHWLFGSDEDRRRMAALSRDWHQGIIRAAKELKGWDFDDTSDLVRLTRLPGTWNHKTKPPKPVELIELDDSRRFTVEELEAIVARLNTQFPPAPPRSARAERRKAARIQADAPANDNSDPTLFQKGSFEAAARGCAWLAYTVENASQLPEPHYYAQAGIVGRCQNGEEIFQKISSADPRYDPAETQKKLEHALEAAGPRTCENICNSLGFEGCKQCPFWTNEEVTSPIQLAGLDPAVAELMATHAYDIETGRYFNLRTRRPYDENAFTNKHRHKTGKKTPHNELITHRFTKKVEWTDYLAGNNEVFVRENKDDIFNLWRLGGVAPQEGDASLIHEHLNLIYPDEGVLKHVLDVLAHVVQKPAEKVNHVVLTIGDQGTGKTTIGNIAQLLVGQENTFWAGNRELSSEWTAQMGNRQLLVFEELGVFDKREVYENLKVWITNEKVTVNQKHVKPYKARTPKLILAFSNHRRATALGEGDRRFFVYHSPAKPRDPSYYKRLYDEGLKQAPAFLHELLHRDISNFAPAEAPPMTDAKADIIAASRPVVQQEIEAMMEEGDYPFWGDLFTLDELCDNVATRVRNRVPPSSREVTDALKELGVVKIDRQVRLGKKQRAWFWAWRNVERWQNATPDELREAHTKSRSADEAA